MASYGDFTPADYSLAAPDPGTGSYGLQPGDYMPGSDLGQSLYSADDYSGFADYSLTSPGNYGLVNNTGDSSGYELSGGGTGYGLSGRDQPDFWGGDSSLAKLQRMLAGQVKSAAVSKVSKTIPGTGTALMLGSARTPQEMRTGMVNTLGSMFGLPGMIGAWGANKLADTFGWNGNNQPYNGKTSSAGPNAGGFSMDLEGIIGGLAGLYGNRGGGNIGGAQANNDAVSQQIQSLGNMYSPDSPYAQQLRQVLERKDAAAGRRSQYGPREVQLMAALADKQASVSDSMGRLAQTNQANQIALQDRKRMQRGQNLATLGGLAKSSGLLDMFRGGGSGLPSGVSNTYVPPEWNYDNSSVPF